MAHLVQFLIDHGYLVLFLWLLAEQAALPLPSIPLLLACGALARIGKLDLFAILLSGLAACLIADNIWFQLGRLRGAKILKLVCRLTLEPDSCVRQTENAFLKYGLRSLLVAKFIPGLNAVAAPLAGSSSVSLARFIVFDSVGVLIWITTYTAVGYILSDELESVAEKARQMGSGLVLLVVGLLAAWIGWKYAQRRRFISKLAVARVTVEELRNKLQANEEVVILDVRTRPDIDTIPGAIHMPAEELHTRHVEIPRDRDIILFCS